MSSIGRAGLRLWFVRGVAMVAGLAGISVLATTMIPGGRCSSDGCLSPTPSATAHAGASTDSSPQKPASKSLPHLIAAAAKTSKASLTSYRSAGKKAITTPKGSPSGSGGPNLTSYPTQDAHSAIRYIANGVTEAIGAVKALGYNVIDTSSTTRSTIDGYRARVIIYTGYDKDLCRWNVPDATWQSQVLNLKDDANVVGWFLADEPHPYDNGRCTASAAQIRARADFLHTNAPGQKAMIVVLDGSNACVGHAEGCEYKFFNEGATHADLIGIDPYVCSTANPTCDYSKITQRVNSAVTNGIPLDKIMPVYQAFGGDGYYLMPTAAQLATMLKTWDGLAPHGGWAGEYTYEWRQESEPDGLSNHPQQQRVFAAHNGA